MHQYKILEKQQKHKRQYESYQSLKSLLKATAEWNINPKSTYHLLGLSSLHNIGMWRSAIDEIILTDEQMEKIGLLLSIQKSLSNLITDKNRLYIWLREPHPEIEYFTKECPLDVFRKANKTQLRLIIEYLIKASSDDFMRI